MNTYKLQAHMCACTDICTHKTHTQCPLIHTNVLNIQHTYFALDTHTHTQQNTAHLHTLINTQYKIVMEVLRHAELIVEWFLWTIEDTTVHLIIQSNVSPITGFVRHTMYVCVSCMPDKARDGRNIALNYQVNCWCARSSKGTILIHNTKHIHECTCTQKYRIYSNRRHTSFSSRHQIDAKLEIAFVENIQCVVCGQ